MKKKGDFLLKKILIMKFLYIKLKFRIKSFTTRINPCFNLSSACETSGCAWLWAYDLVLEKGRFSCRQLLGRAQLNNGPHLRKHFFIISRRESCPFPGKKKPFDLIETHFDSLHWSSCCITCSGSRFHVFRLLEF